MRPVALGRKNWMHIGSSLAGPKVAAILSVEESCRGLRVSVRDHFSAILPGLPISRSDAPDLIPGAWVARLCSTVAAFRTRLCIGPNRRVRGRNGVHRTYQMGARRARARNEEMTVGRRSMVRASRLQR